MIQLRVSAMVGVAAASIGLGALASADLVDGPNDIQPITREEFDQRIVGRAVMFRLPPILTPGLKSIVLTEGPFGGGGECDRADGSAFYEAKPADSKWSLLEPV